METKVGMHIIQITNAEKVLFPDGITKRELVDYYERIAPILLPSIKHHPLVMHRFPNGVMHEGFYHKDIPSYFPDWIDTVEVKKSDGGVTTYAVVDNEATIVYLANFGCITPHMWLSCASKLNYPDLLVFDLDPGSHDFRFTCTVAKRLKKLLERVDLVPFVKTTGSRGLHVTVPLDKKTDFDTVRAAARVFAQQLVNDDPQHITVETSIAKRRGRLFVDIARNAWGQTVAAPYAVRPKHGAPVATPIHWNELSRLSSSQQFTIKNIFRRLSRKEDPWHDIYTYACSLSKIKNIED